MLYSIQATTETRTPSSGGTTYFGAIYSPTIILDSDVQGVTDSLHAGRIVERWLTDAGLTVLNVFASVYLPTQAPTFTQACAG